MFFLYFLFYFFTSVLPVRFFVSPMFKGKIINETEIPSNKMRLEGGGSVEVETFLDLTGMSSNKSYSSVYNEVYLKDNGKFHIPFRILPAPLLCSFKPLEITLNVPIEEYDNSYNSLPNKYKIDFNHTWDELNFYNRYFKNKGYFIFTKKKVSILFPDSLKKQITPLLPYFKLGEFKEDFIVVINYKVEFYDLKKKNKYESGNISIRARFNDFLTSTNIPCYLLYPKNTNITFEDNLNIGLVLEDTLYFGNKNNNSKNCSINYNHTRPINIYNNKNFYANYNSISNPRYFDLGKVINWNAVKDSIIKRSYYKKAVMSYAANDTKTFYMIIDKGFLSPNDFDINFLSDITTSPEEMEVLLKKGLNPNLGSDDKCRDKTLLIEAIRWRNIKTIEILLHYGANPNLCTNIHTPLTAALDYFAHYDTLVLALKILLKAGANPNLKIYKTPLEIARESYKSQSEVVKLLSEYSTKTK